VVASVLEYFRSVIEADARPSLPLTDSDERRMLRESVSNLAESFGHRYFTEVVAANEPPTALWEALGEHGFMGPSIAERYGGGGAGLTELAIVEEEVSAAGMPLLKLLISPAVAGAIVEGHGSEEQKMRWLPGMAAGTDRFSLAVTEPDAGSNTHKISTRARREGDTYVLTGSKVYCSGLEDSNWVLVLAKTGTGDDGRSQLSLFMVEVDHPKLHRTRIPVAMRAPEHTFSKAAQYGREREVWGQPIGAHQGVSHPLAECHANLEAARMMMMAAAALADAGAPAGEAANIAKLLAADAGTKAIDQAIQAHGGNGLADEYGIADLYFIVRLQRIAPVSREMILNYIAQHSLGLPRSY
jgi:alkylation response protein AidB-like acyl-CoA dehydrogenase